MITLKNTPNYAGVTISGDFNDFEALYDSLHKVVGDEWEWESYAGARMRVLSICYDLRHALMGNRDIEFVDNGLDQDRMKQLSIITNDKNTYLAFNVLWPELLFVTMALNDFIRLYAKRLAKNNYNTFTDYRTIWDSDIAHVRTFQATIATCIKETVSEKSVTRVFKIMHSDYTWTHHYAIQYIDELNETFIKMDGEKRLKNISVMAKRIAEMGREYQEVKNAVQTAAKEYGCNMTNIRSMVEYPEIIDW